MKKITKQTFGLKLKAQTAFYGKGIKLAYKVLPYKDPTYNKFDKPVAVAFKLFDKVYVGEPKDGEIMHFLLLTNLPTEAQKILYNQDTENADVCSGFFTSEGCFYTRDQNQRFFGFRESQDGLHKKTKDPIEAEIKKSN